jgi:hypothetical protein
MKRYLIIFFLVLSGTTVFGQKKVDTKISVHVDTLSSSWVVCAHDSTFGLGRYGIIQLSGGGDCHLPCPKFFNSHLDIDTDYLNQIKFSPLATDICFKVSVYNENDRAYAPIYIYDSLGYYTLIELYYDPTKVSSSLRESNKSLPFTILPNPAKGSVIAISFPLANEYGRIIIRNTLGVDELNEKIKPGTSKTLISIADLGNGIYYAHIDLGHFSAVQKFEIRR